MNDTQTLAATPMTDALACVTTDNAVNDRLAALDLCRQLERDLIELRGWFTARMDQVETDLAIARDGCDRWRAAYTAARADRAALVAALGPLLDLIDNRPADMYDSDGGPTDELNIAARAIRATLARVRS